MNYNSEDQVKSDHGSKVGLQKKQKTYISQYKN